MIVRHNSGAVVAEESGVIAGANCVGYVTAQVPKAGNKTFAVTLTDCANPSAAVRVDKLLTSDNFYGYGKFDGADQIWRWDTTANSWAKYFYQKSGGGHGTVATYAWKKWNYGANKVEELTDDDSVNPGETFIFTRSGSANEITLTLSGQVMEFSASPSYSIPKAGNVFMAYPWPIEIKISELQNLMSESTWAALYGYGKFDGADQIWRWDAVANSWAKYFYQKSGGGHGTVATYAWKKWNFTESKVDDLTDADKIVAGEGFIFTRSGSAETLTFTWNALEK